MKNFALIGAAGYIAPRHFRAISETGNSLIAALDNFDSVGFADRYFPNMNFFVEFERFDRHLDKSARKGVHIDYLSVCTPNYLHDSHIRFGLRHGANVICEKPMVLNPWNVEALADIESESDGSIFNILQLRLHPDIIELKNRINQMPDEEKFDVDLTYITPRGKWYYTSWKGDISKSGGIATNIGIHFFDMLSWLFGDVEESTVHLNDFDRASGFLELKRARVRWFLSINPETIPSNKQDGSLKTFRSITIAGKEIEFSDGFQDLHTTSYEGILKDEGFGIEEASKSIFLVHNIRNSKTASLSGDYHPLAKLKRAQHPFQKK